MKAKTIFITLLFLFAFVSAQARWVKSAGPAFSKAKEYKVEIYMDSVNYDGMSKIEFLEYTAAKNDMQPEQILVSLKYMGREILKEFNESSKKSFSSTIDSPCIIKIHILKITSKAGINSRVDFCLGDFECSFDFNVDDGRWNRFDVLLQENCEELVDKINTRIKKLRYYKE